MINLEKKIDRKSASPSPLSEDLHLQHTSTPFFNFQIPSPLFCWSWPGRWGIPKKEKARKNGSTDTEDSSTSAYLYCTKKKISKKIYEESVCFYVFFFVTKKLYKKLKKALKNYDYWTLLICLDMVQKRYTLRQLLICLERGVLEVVLYGRGGNDSLVRKTGLPGWVEVGGNYTD